MNIKLSFSADVKVKEEVVDEPEQASSSSKMEEDSKPDINELKENENMPMKNKMSALSALTHTQPLKEKNVSETSGCS